MTNVDFTKFKLGTLWLNLSNGKIYKLRRKTDSKTLVGTLYMFCKEDLSYIYDLTVDKWEMQ